MSTRKSVIEQLFESGDAGDLDRLRALLDEHVIVHAPFGLSTVGATAEQESWRRAKAAIPDLRHAFQTVVCNGPFEAGRCVVTGTLRGEYGGFRADAAPFQVDQGIFARVENGTIVELWEIVDTASLLAQLKAGSQR